MALLNCYLSQDMEYWYPYNNLTNILIINNVLKEKVKIEILKVFLFKQNKYLRFIRKNNRKISKLSERLKQYGNFYDINLWYSSRVNNLIGVKWSIKNCPIKNVDNNFMKALGVSCNSGNFEIVKFLVHYFNTVLKFNGQYIYLRNSLENCFSNACTSGNFELVSWLISINFIDFDGEDILNALTFACQAGQVKIVELLLTKANIDINRIVNELCYGNVKSEIIKLLILKGTSQFNRILVCGSASNDFELINFAIAHGANDFDGALTHACEYGNLNVAKFLVNCGANNFSEALYEACKNGKFKIVKWLETIKTFNLHDYNEALVGASFNGHLKIAKWAVSRGANDFNSVLISCPYSRLDIAKWAILNGADDLEEVFRAKIDCPKSYQDPYLIKFILKKLYLKYKEKCKNHKKYKKYKKH